jgi:hypothetical protein
MLQQPNSADLVTYKYDDGVMTSPWQPVTLIKNCKCQKIKIQLLQKESSYSMKTITNYNVLT